MRYATPGAIKRQGPLRAACKSLHLLRALPIPGQKKPREPGEGSRGQGTDLGERFRSGSPGERDLRQTLNLSRAMRHRHHGIVREHPVRDGVRSGRQGPRSRNRRRRLMACCGDLRIVRAPRCLPRLIRRRHNRARYPSCSRQRDLLTRGSYQFEPDGSGTRGFIPAGGHALAIRRSLTTLLRQGGFVCEGFRAGRR